MNKLYGHFMTITTHRHEVIRNCKKAGILWQGLFHDLSKYLPAEFFSGVKYYLGNKSPNTAERKDIGYSKAWLHHKGRNKHHFEYWTDYGIVAGKIMPVKMPLKYVIEMFCDRVAASKIYMKDDYTNDYPLEYFMRGKPNRFIHEDTSDLIERLLVMLKEKGEEETFSYVRKLKNQKDY